MVELWFQSLIYGLLQSLQFFSNNITLGRVHLMIPRDIFLSYLGTNYHYPKHGLMYVDVIENTLICRAIHLVFFSHIDPVDRNKYRALIYFLLKC